MRTKIVYVIVDDNDEVLLGTVKDSRIKSITQHIKNDGFGVRTESEANSMWMSYSKRGFKCVRSQLILLL